MNIFFNKFKKVYIMFVIKIDTPFICSINFLTLLLLRQNYLKNRTALPKFYTFYFLVIMK